MKHYAVLDIGGGTIKHAVMDEQAETLKSGITKTPVQGMNATFAILKDIVREYQKEYTLNGVALSVPGAVEIVTGYIHFAGAVTDLMGRNVKEELNDLGLPIELDNDVNCVTLAEKWKGSAMDCDNFVCIAAGTGIGGGIFINGKLYRGRLGMAGEFGLMALRFDNKLETVMQRGSFSALGSTRALVEDASARMDFAVTGEDIFRLADQGNSDALAALENFYDALAIGTANLIHVLAPEKILIGGGVSAQTVVVKEVRNRIARIRKPALDITEVESCSFKNEAGKVGALYHFLTMQGILS